MSDFARRHYVDIARILQDTHAARAQCEAFACLFARDNPRFNVERFMEACGYRD